MHLKLAARWRRFGRNAKWKPSILCAAPAGRQLKRNPLGCEELQRMSAATIALALAYALAAIPLVSTLVQWSAALRCTYEVGRVLTYGESYSLSESAWTHAEIAGFTMLIVLPTVLAAPVAIAVARYFRQRVRFPLLLWALGIGAWWASVGLSPAFRGFVSWYLD